MKLFKSLLLGSAAAIVAISGASAADLGAKKPTPVEFVRACYNPLWGTAGGFIIPGSETCLRISGQARFDIGYGQPFFRNSNFLGYRGIGTVTFDAVTPTEIGQVRAFVQLGLSYRSGNQASGTGARQGTFFGGTFANLTGSGGGTDLIQQAFIQIPLAGGTITAGRTASFFDPIGIPEIIGSTFRSSPGNVNTIGYTANFGGGFLATIAIEDPTLRRQGVVHALAGAAPFFGVGGPYLNFIPTLGANGGVVGAPGAGTGAIQQIGNRMPNFVAALRLNQAWGQAQLSAVVKEVSTAGITAFGGTGFVAPGVLGPAFVAGLAGPTTKYGFAVSGSVKINLPMIAAGDALFLGATYGSGAINYVTSNVFGGSSNNQGIGGAGLLLGDAVFDNATGRVRLINAWSLYAAFQHFWTPQISSTIFGSYARVEVPSTAAVQNYNFGTLGDGNTGFPGTLLVRSADFWSVGVNTVWTPVRGLSIGAEVAYVVADPKGRVYDYNKNASLLGAPVCNVGGPPNLCRLKGSDGAVSARLRIVRDF